MTTKNRVALSPSQAIPARHVAALSFQAPDVFIAGTLVKLGQCGDRFKELLGERANAVMPRRFISESQLQPWPNNLVFRGRLDNVVANPKPDGHCIFKFAITLCLNVEGPGGGHTLDVKSDTTTGTVITPATDPDSLFAALVPLITKVFDEILAALASNSNFNTYPWGSSVASVDNGNITIAAAKADNLQPGNLLEIARSAGGSSAGVFNKVALIQVVSTDDLSSSCIYYGNGNQPILVEDGVFVVDVSTGQRIQTFRSADIA